MNTIKRIGVTLLVATMAAGACSESGPPRPDVGLKDARGEGGLDGASDAESSDLRDDAPVDTSSDIVTLPEAGYDFPRSDAPLSSASVLYLVGKSEDELSLRRVAADGREQPLAVTGFSGLLALDALAVAGARPRVALRGDEPRVVEGGFPRIHLPDGSSLLYVHRRLLGTSALVRAGADGSVRALLEVSGLYADAIGSRVAFDAAARHAAVASAAGAALHWVKVDGGTFVGGATAMAVGLPAEVSTIAERSLRLVGDVLVFVAELRDGDRALYRAAVAPTLGAATPVAVDGAEASAFMGDDLVVQRGGGAVLFSASDSRDGAQHLYRFDAASGEVTRLTADAKVLVPVEDGSGTRRGRRALSPSYVAYLAEANGGSQLHVAPALADAEPVIVTRSSNFDLGAASIIEGFVFAAGDVLLFWAGVGANQLDLYLYDAAADTLVNLTDPSAAKPYAGQGALAVATQQENEAGSGLYFVGESFFEGYRNLFFYPYGGVGRQLSAQIRLSTRPSDFAHCAADDALYLVALTEVGRPWLEIFSTSLARDDNLAQETNLAGAGPWSVADLQLSADCRTLLFGAGPFTASFRLWALDTETKAVRPITAIPRHLAPWPRISPDGSTVVYASGGAADALTLKASRSVGGGEITLDNKAGAVEILAID